MTAGTCSATVTVVGIGTFTCEDVVGHDGYHTATLPGDDKWATVAWKSDNATIAPPGSRRGRRGRR